VAGRGRNRTGLSSTRPMPTKKEQKSNKQLPIQENSNTHNYFSRLTSEEDTDNIQRRKQPAPTPIFVPGIKNAQRLMTMIEEKIRRKDYTVKIINDTIKILTTKLEDHKEAAGAGLAQAV
jgi:hypothetical protein